MHDFFARQKAAKRTSLLLYLYFAAAMAVFGTVLAVVVYVFFYTGDPLRLYEHATPFNFTPSEWEYLRIFRIAAVIFVFITAGSIYKYYRLRFGGGDLIAQMLGGRIIYPDTHDFRERRLLNIVEEMAIASGVTVPTIYLMEREWGINAFAAGFTEQDAVFGVTKGAIYYLNRDELQGVIAHEFSHILNGDMLVNIRLQGLLHGILVIGLLGETMIKSFFEVRPLHYDRDEQQSRNGAGAIFMILGVALLMIGYIGVFAGRLIKSAISRQREYLADASAVQFTRNPLGLAEALKKIGGLVSGSRIRSSRASEISHMYFGNGLAPSWFNLLSTHPPLIERIKRLDPGFNGHFPVHKRISEIDQAEVIKYAASSGASAGLGPGADRSGATVSAPAGQKHLFIHSLLAGKNFSGVTQATEQDHPRFVREILDNFPVTVREAAQSSEGAEAILYGLLLDDEKEARQQQLQVLTGRVKPSVIAKLESLWPEIKRLVQDSRLYLVDYLLPALAPLAPDQLKRMRSTVRKLLKVDGKITYFEYAIYKIFIRRLTPDSGVWSNSQTGRTDSAAEVSSEISTVLTFMARQGNRYEGDARKALMRAVNVFGKDAKRFDFLAREVGGFSHFDQALAKLSGCTMELRCKIRDVCMECIAHDETVTIGEAELLRGVVEVLECPSPHWLTLQGRDDWGETG